MKIVWSSPEKDPETGKKVVVKTRFMHTTKVFFATFNGENFVEGATIHDNDNVFGWADDSEEVSDD